jgi:hypothetical protein
VTTVKTIAEREIRPTTATLLVVDVLHEGVIVRSHTEWLHSVRDGFAWTMGEDDEGTGGPYCLEGGWLQCDHDSGVRLSGPSLQACVELSGRGRSGP